MPQKAFVKKNRVFLLEEELVFIFGPYLRPILESPNVEKWIFFIGGGCFGGEEGCFTFLKFDKGAYFGGGL